jgi:hypothetical protein
VIPARKRKDVKHAGRTCVRWFTLVRLNISLGIALVDFVKQEVKRKLARRLVKKWLD